MSRSSALDVAGPQAAAIGQLWWLMLWLCVAVFVVLMAALAWGLWRSRGGSTTQPVEPLKDRVERRAGLAVWTAVVLSALALTGLLVASVGADRAIASLPLANALDIRVTAHQWWWEVTYADPQPTRTFTTANEFVIPVGRPVVVTLQADDVIHSFWIPELHGKKDLIPGRVAKIELRADRAGTFTGRCAEYCGLQHAFMAFDVVAMPADRFEAWQAHQRSEAPEPQADDARRGHDLFMTGSCMMCHAIQGTSADGRRAPDLTHFASRAHIGAGRVANTPQALAAWIEDPGRIKPGANMPAHLLPPEDNAALVAYLETLR